MAPATAVPPGARRPRVGLTALLAATLGLGLLSRRYPLPGLLAEHTGDALYATAAFFLLALVRPRAATGTLGLLAFAWAAAVEGSQLLTWPWLGELRATRWGALLLGQGFQVADLFAYGGGSLLACLVDVTFVPRSIRRTEGPDRLPHQSTGPRA